MFCRIIYSRYLLSTFILNSLFFLSCNDLRLPENPQTKLNLDYEFDTSGYVFFIQSLIRNDKFLLKGSEILQPSAETVRELNVRWGFRNKTLQTVEGINAKVYWMQTNEAYLKIYPLLNFAIVVNDSNKQKFIPQEFPDPLLQKAEDDLEIYAVVSSRSFHVSSAINIPSGMKRYLTGTVEINGNILNQTALADSRAANVGGASIHYINKASHKIFQTFSKKDSSYRIFVQGYGDYLVSVLRFDMNPLTKAVKLLENPSDRIIEQSIMLDELPAGISIANNQLYDISNSALDIYTESTGPRVNGLSMNIQDHTAIPEAYLLFYKHLGKVYFLRSDNLGSFSGKLPSSTAYNSVDEIIQDLTFYPSVLGYTPIQGFIKLTSPRMIDIVGFKAEP